MTRVCESPAADTRAIVTKCEIVIWLSPTELLSGGCNGMLLVLGSRLTFSNFVELLVFAVFAEVFLII